MVLCLIHNSRKKLNIKKNAIKKASTVVTEGGSLPELDPTLYKQCILSNILYDAIVVKEETFCQLCLSFTFNSIEEVIGEVNSTEFV